MFKIQKSSRNLKTKIFYGSLILLNIYVYISSIFLIYIFSKYYFINLKNIEPINYIPEIIEPVCRTGIYESRFNTFFCTINNLGSRNLFDVSKEDRNLVVLLGDSHFFGAGLNDNETIGFLLNKIDSTKKYVNLSVRGFNICDSVERYLTKYNQISSPSIIIFEISLGNDLYASLYIENLLARGIKRDFRYILPPFSTFIKEYKFLYFCKRNIEKKVLNDLSDKRFIEYVQNPLNKLIEVNSRNKTKLIIISYDAGNKFANYNNKLKNFCLENKIFFFELDELIPERYIREDRLADGHPSANFNRVLAARIKNIIKNFL